MTEKTYCMVNKETNIVDNTCVWDGDITKWTPPDTHLLLEQETTPSKIWVEPAPYTEYVLELSVGHGGVGFTWDGETLITNDPKPQKSIPVVQPISSGAQTL